MIPSGNFVWVGVGVMQDAIWMHECPLISSLCIINDHLPDSKVHGAKMGAIWGRQDPGGPHVGPMNFAIWAVYFTYVSQGIRRGTVITQ